MLPLVLTLPICVPIIALWTDPPRFLVFRSFNHAQVTGTLRKHLKREVAPFGHVYTLSDADIKVPWYVRVPLFVGQLALFSFRLRLIRGSADVALSSSRYRQTGTSSARCPRCRDARYSFR